MADLPLPQSAPAAAVPQDGAAGDPASPLFERVSAVIERIRPAVQADGGDVELVRVDDAGVAHIRLHGACIGCPSSNMTLHMGIERNVCQLVPEIKSVRQVD
jgi:Fe-S cluster biogenesis protein NfuA